MLKKITKMIWNGSFNVVTMQKPALISSEYD